MKPKCLVCSKQLVKRGAKHCRSHIPISEKTREKYRKHMFGNSFAKGKNLGNQQGFKKGQVPFNKGGHNLWVTGENHHFWKGDKVDYRTLHHWVSRHLGTPSSCEHCGKSGLSGKNIHWANKSGKYLRELSDWIRLCSTCHGVYDRKNGSRKRKTQK